MKVLTSLIETDGDAGSATGSKKINVNGVIYAVELNYTNLPNTTDVELKSGATEVLTRSNSATDETFYPRVAASKPDGSASTLTEVGPAVRKLDVAIAQADPNGELEITLWVE